MDAMDEIANKINAAVIEIVETGIADSFHEELQSDEKQVQMEITLNRKRIKDLEEQLKEEEEKVDDLGNQVELWRA